MSKNKEYTVLLRRPDYVTTDEEDQLYLDHVKAPSPKLAAFLSRRRAIKADGQYTPDCGPTPEDYAVVFLCEGFVKDLSFKVNS